MRKLKFVGLHEPLFVPELGQLSASLPPDKKFFANKAHVTNMTMYLTDQGVELSVAGIDALIPLVNVKVMVFDKPSDELKIKSDDSVVRAMPYVYGVERNIPTSYNVQETNEKNNS